MIVEKIVDVAHCYIGQEEKPNNSGFEDAEFEAAMTKVGWEAGEAWCASFAKLVWREAYKTDAARLLEVERLFSKSAVQTYRQFDASDWKTQNEDGSPIVVPQVGALVVWQFGDSTKGHIGIVARVFSQTEFETIEGNTDDNGGREGIKVAYRRRIVRRARGEGLNLLGFVLPKPLSEK
jgi:surface antigen